MGEQYVELQPQSDDGPYLHDGSEIDEEDTQIPIATETLLANLSTTVELGRQGGAQDHGRRVRRKAFAGTGEDLQRIIDSGNSFIDTANANFDVTTALIRDSNTVLHGQIDSESAIRNFASAAAGVQQRPRRRRPRPAPPDRDRVDVAPSSCATFIEANRVELGST